MHRMGGREAMEQPEIRGSHSFQCGFCTDITKKCFCERHAHVWSEFSDLTKLQALDRIVEYNSIILPSVVDRKKLQLFVNRLVVYDELNKLKNAKVNIQAPDKQNRFYKYLTVGTPLLTC